MTKCLSLERIQYKGIYVLHLLEQHLKLSSNIYLWVVFFKSQAYQVDLSLFYLIWNNKEEYMLK